MALLTQLVEHGQAVRYGTGARRADWVTQEAVDMTDNAMRSLHTPLPRLRRPGQTAVASASALWAAFQMCEKCLT